MDASSARISWIGALVVMASAGCAADHRSNASAATPDAGIHDDAGPTTQADGGLAVFTLKVDVERDGFVRSNALPAECHQSCEVTLPAFTRIELDAVADETSFFQSWSGSCYEVGRGAGADAVCMVFLSSDLRIGAKFIGRADAGTTHSGERDGGAACSQQRLAAVEPRTYVTEPAGREPESVAGDGSGTLLLGMTGPENPNRGNEAVMVSPEGSTIGFLLFPKTVELHAEPFGFSGLRYSFSGFFSIERLDADATSGGGIGFVQSSLRPGVQSVRHPQSGTLVVGNFRRGSEAESSASPRATFVSGGAPPAEVWSVPLASSGATLGAGLDLVGNALVITDGTARWGAGATSAQWISSSGIDLTGDFLLFSSEPSEWGWLEASPLVGGGLAIRRVKVTDMFRRELASRYLCVLAVGSTACEPAPEWLSLRANVRIEPVRNGTAYAALPDPMFVPDCKQTVELVDATGISCGSIELRMTHGSCRTRELGVGQDGTLIQPLANEAWQCAAPRGCRATWRWWPGLFR